MSLPTYARVYELYVSDALHGRVIVAVARAAADILAEAPETPGHAARLEWAHAALGDAPAMMRRVLWAVCLNGAIAAAGESASDADLQYVVNSEIPRLVAARVAARSAGASLA